MRVLLAPMPAAQRLQLRRLLRDMPGIDGVSQLMGDRPLLDVAHETGVQFVLLDTDHVSEHLLHECMANAAITTCLLLHPAQHHTAGIVPIDPKLELLERPVTLDNEPWDGPFALKLRQRLGVKDSTLQGSNSPTRIQIKHLATTKFAPRRFDVLAIGASTGGPQALQIFFAELVRLGQPITFPLLVTQHMAVGFIPALAHSLQTNTAIPTFEAEDGMLLLPGHAYLAPGGRHLRMEQQGLHAVCRLDDGPAENFCKPSVDVMLRSLTQTASLRTLVVMLTGMGQDGLLGCQRLHAGGSFILAQDRASSVVWGMPGAVAQAGICRAVLSLEQLASHVLDLAGTP